jgi:GGDEF domain-containing protein
MITFTAAAVAVLYTVADRIIEDVLHIDAYWGQLLEVVVMALVTSVVLWLAVLRPLHRQSTAGEEMAATEEMAYHSTTKALAIALDGLDAELLLADSSEAHLKRVLAVRDEGLAACGVVAPHDCPAIRRSQSLQFESSGALDACPYLDQRPSGPCSAACVPVSVGGRSIGVLHAVGPDGRPATSVQIARWEAVATQVGSHIGMLRVMSTATLQAATDPLTGLLNRRSFENRVHAQLRLGRPFALAMGDLDHFKRLNDAHGHGAGD